MLLVDDDKAFRTLVHHALTRAGFLLVEAADADKALEAIDEHHPDLVLLDICLPRVSGYELYRELRDQLGDTLPIVFISGERTDSYDRTVGLLLGADDYLVKPLDPDELVARVRRLLAHPSGRPSTTDPASPVHSQHPISELTSREREVLELLAMGKSSKEIANELVISPRTVGTHIQHILSKLGVHNRTQAVIAAHDS